MGRCDECGALIFKSKSLEEKEDEETQEKEKSEIFGHCDNCSRDYCGECMEECLKCWGCESMTFCNKCDPYSKREPNNEELLDFLLITYNLSRKKAIKMWQKEQDIVPVMCAVCNNCDENECDNLRDQYLPLSPSQHENTYKLSNDKLRKSEEGAKYYPHRRPLGCCCQCYFPIQSTSIGYSMREEWCSKCLKRSIL